MLGALAALGAAWSWRRSVVGPARTRAAALGSPRSWVPTPVHRVLVPYVARIAPGRTVGEVLGWWGIGSALALMVGLALGPVGVGVALVGTVAAGPIALASARRRAVTARRAALPEFAHAVARALRSGAALVPALTTVPVPPALDAEVGALRARLTAGEPLVDALAGWASEHADAGTRALAGALAVVHLEGGRAADPLDGLADALAARDSVAREAAALATQARLSAVVILLAPIAFVLVGGVAAPDQIAHLTTTWAGRVCLLAGLGLDVIGGWWMHRIVEGVA